MMNVSRNSMVLIFFLSNNIVSQARDVITSNYGKHLRTVSTVCPSLLLLTRRSSVVTAGWAPTSRAWSRSEGSWGRPTSPTPACSATSCGRIQTRTCRAGGRTTEGWVMQRVLDSTKRISNSVNLFQVSFTFGADVVSKFLNRHDLDLICRAHQVNIKQSGLK